MRNNSPIKLYRKMHSNGRWFHLCHILEENRFYFVHDHNSLGNFVNANNIRLGSWTSDTPWDVIEDGVNSPQEVMTSSYEEVCNYLKMNALIGVIE